MRNFSLNHSCMACVNEGSHSFTCHPLVYPHMERAILPSLTSRRASAHFGRHSCPVPLRVGGWVGLGVSRGGGRQSNSRPSSCKSNALTTRLPGQMWSGLRKLERRQSHCAVLWCYIAVGCAQLAEPVGGWVKQDSEEAVLGCHGDVDNTWRLVCHGSTWIGDHHNCTSGESCLHAISSLYVQFTET